MKRAAPVGTHSLPKVLYQVLKTFSQCEFCRFNTREAAMDWLVREENVTPTQTAAASDDEREETRLAVKVISTV